MAATKTDTNQDFKKYSGRFDIGRIKKGLEPFADPFKLQPTLNYDGWINYYTGRYDYYFLKAGKPAQANPYKLWKIADISTRKRILLGDHDIFFDRAGWIRVAPMVALPVDNIDGFYKEKFGCKVMLDGNRCNVSPTFCGVCGKHGFEMAEGRKFKYDEKLDIFILE